MSAAAWAARPIIGQDDPRLPARGTICSRYLRGDPARLQSRTAGATTTTRRASRSWCTRSAPRSSRAQVEAELAAHPRRRAQAARRRDRAHRGLFRAARLRAPAGAAPSLRARRATTATSRAGSTRNTHAAQGARLRHRHHLAEADRRHARRRHAPSRWTRSPISPSAIRFDEMRVTPRAEPGPAACAHRRSAGGL